MQPVETRTCRKKGLNVMVESKNKQRDRDRETDTETSINIDKCVSLCVCVHWYDRGEWQLAVLFFFFGKRVVQYWQLNCQLGDKNLWWWQAKQIKTKKRNIKRATRVPNDDPIATPNFTDNLNPNSLLIPLSPLIRRPSKRFSNNEELVKMDIQCERAE